ncbi:MAG: hypothetical protein Q4D54_07455 [Eubacteriales bacterium]|nr:hypothetical protein [Lachnospiraceae bacterium]MDO5127568.1 hypothetical protein [Eubacteriales bacterium]
MKKRKLSKWLLALGICATVATGLKAPMAAKAASALGYTEEVAYPGTWSQDEKGWKYTCRNASGREWTIDNGIRIIDGKPYAFKDGYMVTGGWSGWTTILSSYRVYAGEDGVLATGWQKIDGKEYYFYGNGLMACQTYIDEKYYVDENGVYQGKDQWKTDGSRWWYEHGNPKYYKDYDEASKTYTYRNYPKNTTRRIGRYCYAFDGDGYMMTGWIHDVFAKGTDDWYYAYADGRLAGGWNEIDGKWYYFDKSKGEMYKDTIVDGYKVGADGAMISAAGQWKKDTTGWWYEFAEPIITYDENGNEVEIKYPQKTTWQVDGIMYFFDENGYMMTGWVDSNQLEHPGGYWMTGWYYMDEDGKPISQGWHMIDGQWYFFPYANGWMMRNGTFDGYEFDRNGGYKPCEQKNDATWGWKTDGSRWWYEYEDGSYPVFQKCTIDGKIYAFDKEGYMLTGWVRMSEFDDNIYHTNDWCYFESDGSAAYGWKQIDGNWYYFDDGYMYHDTYINVKYYVDENGVWDGKTVDLTYVYN